MRVVASQVALCVTLGCSGASEPASEATPAPETNETNGSEPGGGGVGGLSAALPSVSSSDENVQGGSSGMAAHGGMAVRAGSGGAGGDTGQGGAGSTQGGGGSSAPNAPAAAGGERSQSTEPLQGNALAAATFGLCAIDAQGQLSCWGYFEPLDPPSTPGTFSDVWTGAYEVCARHEGAFVECFEEGLGSLIQLDVPAGDFVQAAPNPVTCLLDAEGMVACAGTGYMGDAPSDRFSQVVTTNSGIACGILLEDGSVVCWGSAPASDGACTTPPRSLLTPPAGPFVELSAGFGHACGIRVDGTLACWGAGVEDDDPEPCDPRVNHGQAIAPAGTFLEVAAGRSHTCAIRTDGTLECWGAGKTIGDCESFYDECGQSMPPDGAFALVASAADYSCAMRSDRSIECWGNEWGGWLQPPPPFQ